MIARRRPRDLTVVPTIAMRQGQQSVFQCSWCGTVVVQPRPASSQLGVCPCCERPGAAWWQQSLPVAGLEAGRVESANEADDEVLW